MCGERVSRADFIGSEETLIASWQGWTGHCWRLLWASSGAACQNAFPCGSEPSTSLHPHPLIRTALFWPHPPILLFHPSIRPTMHASLPTCFVPLLLFPPTTLSITTSHYLCSLRKERKNWEGSPESVRGRIMIRVEKWKHPSTLETQKQKHPLLLHSGIIRIFTNNPKLQILPTVW